MIRRKKRPGRRARKIDFRRAVERRLDRLGLGRLGAKRRTIVYLARDGQTPVEIAGRVGVSVSTVYRWLARFLAGGPEALHTPSRPPSGRRLAEEKVRRIRALLQGGRSSTRRIAALVGVSQSAVARIARRLRSRGP